MHCEHCGKKAGITYRDRENHRDLCERCFDTLVEASTSPVGDSKKKRHG